MGLLDRLFGRRDASRSEWGAGPSGRAAPNRRGPITEDQAIERYRYLLRTAPPEAIEQAHAEAFSQLTPEQRQEVLRELSANLPGHERQTSDDPRSLARMATRAEMRQPGTLERSFGGARVGGMGGIGFGGMMASSLLGSIAGVVIGSAVADAIFNDGGYDQGDSGDAGDAGADSADAGFDSGDAGFDASSDFGGGDFGGDFGGGEF